MPDFYETPPPPKPEIVQDKPSTGQGSVFVNNTSYSGADIKIVVSLYDAGKAANQYTQQYEDAVTQAATDQFTTINEIYRIQAALESVHTGTQEEINLQKRLSQLRQRSDQLVDTVPALQDRSDAIRKDSAQASTKVLAEVQTLSISLHRDKQPVYACGSVYPRGWTRGPRNIAGSIIFTVFDEHVLYQFLEAHASDFDATAYTTALLDQLPPVDIVAAFANEYGHLSRLAIYGVEFINEGQTMSIEDIITENVVQFVARDYDPMRSVAQRKIDQNSNMINNWQPMRASQLLLEEDYKAIKDSINPFTRARRRRNPFL